MTEGSVLNYVRPNIRDIKPYRCARDDYKEGVLLDANENTHGVAVHDLSEGESALSLNRYPDPHQRYVKQLLCDFRNSEENTTGHSLSGIEPLTPENICLGVGSDEAVDSMIRAFCSPGKDKLLICPPTYDMYNVNAKVNDVEIVQVMLNLDNFDIDKELVVKTLNSDSTIKMVYITTPGNPTAKQIAPSKIFEILDRWHGGIVAVDEAYIDFCGGSMCRFVEKYPRLVVLQTLSKSFGLAGLRLGASFACKEISTVLNALKAPYNISNMTSLVAQRALQPESINLMKSRVAQINVERARLVKRLSEIKGVTGVIGGNDANFILVQLSAGDDVAFHVYKGMAEKYGVVTRFRGRNPGCTGCLRIAVGTSQENDLLITAFENAMNDI